MGSTDNASPIAAAAAASAAVRAAAAAAAALVLLALVASLAIVRLHLGACGERLAPGSNRADPHLRRFARRAGALHALAALSVTAALAGFYLTLRPAVESALGAGSVRTESGLALGSAFAALAAAAALACALYERGIRGFALAHPAPPEGELPVYKSPLPSDWART